MRLIPPDTRLQCSYLAAVDEFADDIRHGDGRWVWVDEAGMEHPWSRADLETPDGFAEFVARRRDPEADLPPGWVPCTYLWMDHDGEYVGSLAIRHHLTDFLAAEGGHIGYGVRPSARGQGFATEALRQALTVCRDDLGLVKVLLTCDDDNAASARVIEANGGVLQDVVAAGSDGRALRRYWIALD